MLPLGHSCASPCVLGRSSGRVNRAASTVRCRKRSTRPVASSKWNEQSGFAGVQQPSSAAKLRLQQLLSGVGDGYTELVSNHLSGLSPNLKVFMWLNITLGGSLIGYGPLALLDAVLGLDPIGDTWSLQSAQSLLMGVAASAPLVLITAASWMPQVKRQVPLFEEFHEAQVDVHKPLMSGMSSAQMAISAMAAAFSIELLVLPGMFQHVRFLEAMSTQLQGILQSDLMLSLKDGVAQMSIPSDATSVLFALLLATVVAAGGEAALHMGKLGHKEATVVQEAIDNADRYYRLMSMSAEATVQDAELAADAFKAEASSWLNKHKRVALAAAGYNALVTVYLGAIYMACDNFTTPAVAGMLATLAQWSFLYEQVQGAEGAEGANGAQRARDAATDERRQQTEDNGSEK